MLKVQLDCSLEQEEHFSLVIPSHNLLLRQCLVVNVKKQELELIADDRILLLEPFHEDE